MKTKIGHTLYLLIFFASIIFIATIWLRSDIKSLQSFDAYDKLHQAYSIAHNNLQSETLVYTGSDFDADHRFAFLSDVTMIKLPDGRRVSAFPIAFAITGLPFAFLNSIVPGSFDFSPLVSLIPLIIIWALLLRFKFHPIIFIIGLWGNFLWLQVFLYAEYLLSTMLVFVGFWLLLNNTDQKITQNLKRNSFWGGLSLASAVWFRHEALVYGIILVSSLFTILWLKNRSKLNYQGIDLYRKKLFYFSISFTFTISLWLIFNLIDYGHILGPRYLVNKATQLVDVTTTLNQVWSLFISDKLYRLGFFAFMPLTIIPFIGRIFQKKESSTIIEDTTLLSTALFLIGMSIIAPNSGFSGVGPRYLIFAVIPSYLLVGWWFVRLTSKFWRITFLTIGLLTCLLPLITYKLQSLAAGFYLQARNEIEKSNTDIFIFPNPDLFYLSGPALIGKESYLAQNQADLIELIDLLHKNRKGKSISLIQMSDALTQQATTNSIDVAAWQQNLNSQLQASQWPPAALKRLKNTTELKGKFVDIYQID